jgi:hypothetical protein
MVDDSQQTARRYIPEDRNVQHGGQAKWPFTSGVMKISIEPLELSNWNLVRRWIVKIYKYLKKPPWPESGSELYQPNDHLWSKLVPTFCG